MEDGMDWVAYFEWNRQRKRTIPWDLGVMIPPELRVPLVRSLQRFQVGERGDGAHLRAAARAMNDERYSQAIALFIAEEQVHAGMLARAIHTLGGNTIEAHWTESCFIRMRRLAGLRVELLVLATAELIGLGYYRALRDGIDDALLRCLFAKIVRDEEAHIAFHAHSLHRLFETWPTPSRAVALCAWRGFFTVVSAVVAYDHRPVLSRVGLTRPQFMIECGELRAAMEARIVDGPHSQERRIGHLQSWNASPEHAHV
jgi:hypothetical protein